MTAQLGPRWRTKAAFSTGRRIQRGVLPAQDGSSNPLADYSIDEINPNYSASASVDFTPSSRWYLSMRTGYFFRDLYNEGVYRGDRYQFQTSSVGFPGVPEVPAAAPVLECTDDFTRDRTEGPHLGIQVDSTLFVSAAGAHSSRPVSSSTASASIRSRVRPRTDSRFLGPELARDERPVRILRGVQQRPSAKPGFITEGDATVSNLGLFVQDAWTIGRRLTVHLGLRTENENVPSLSRDPRIPRTAIEFGFGDKLAPASGLPGTPPATERRKSTARGASSTTSPSWVVARFWRIVVRASSYTLDAVTSVPS